MAGGSLTNAHSLVNYVYICDEKRENEFSDMPLNNYLIVMLSEMLLFNNELWQSLPLFSLSMEAE